jgi:hypothetical protein
MRTVTPATGHTVTRFAWVLLFALGASLLLPEIGAATLYAQTVPAMDVNKPFKVAATHDGVGTTHYVLTIDRPGTLVNLDVPLPVSALLGGEVSFDVPAQATVGAYTATVCARNVDPADATNFGQNCTAAVAFTVAKPVMAPPPTKPTIRLVGTVTIAGKTVPAVFDVAAMELVTADEAPRTLRLGEIGR